MFSIQKRDQKGFFERSPRPLMRGSSWYGRAWCETCQSLFGCLYLYHWDVLLFMVLSHWTILQKIILRCHMCFSRSSWCLASIVWSRVRVHIHWLETQALNTLHVGSVVRFVLRLRWLWEGWRCERVWRAWVYHNIKILLQYHYTTPLIKLCFNVSICPFIAISVVFDSTLPNKTSK